MAGRGEIVGGAKGQDGKRGSRLRRDAHEPVGSLVDTAIAPAGDHPCHALPCRLRDEACDVAPFPRHPHVERVARGPNRLHGVAHVGTIGLFAVENEACLHEGLAFTVVP